MEAIINKLPEDINYMFYIKPKGAKRFSTYNPGKGTMGTGLVFTELYHKEHLLAICKWIAEDNGGEWIYQLRSAGGKKIYWEYDSMLATPPETPQISKETAETANVSAEGEKGAERAGNKPERKIKYFHYTPEQLKRYIIDVYDKRSNGEWVLDHQEDSDHGYFDVIDDKVIYWHNKSVNSFSYANMDFDSPTCGRCFRINSTYQKEKYVVSNEILLEFMRGDTYRNIHKQTVYNNGKYEHYYTIQDRYGDFNVGDFSYTFDGIMQRFNDYYKDYATIIWQSPESAPRSPETPQTAQSLTSTDKLAQTA